MFAHPVVLIVALVALGVVFVLIPVALYVRARFRWPLVLKCPETGRPTSVQVNVLRAALTALFGEPSLRVKGCARWPARKDCGQGCMAEAAEKDSAHLHAHPPGGWQLPHPPPVS